MRKLKILLPLIFGLILTFAAVGGLAQAGRDLATVSTLTVCEQGCDYTSIQEAINAASTGDTIDLATGIYTETITLNKSLNIVGKGAQYTIIQAVAAELEASSRVITVTTGVTATIQGVTIRNGYETGQNGGGIHNSGTLTITESMVSNNWADFGSGGGIFNQGNLFIYDSRIKGNRAGMAPGGGIYHIGYRLVLDSTSIYQNHASFFRANPI